MAKKIQNTAFIDAQNLRMGTANDPQPGKIVLVSGDGDYKKVVSRLISTNKLKAILFPGKNWSSLYCQIDNKFKIKLYKKELRNVLQLEEAKK